MSCRCEEMGVRPGTCDFCIATGRAEAMERTSLLARVGAAGASGAAGAAATAFTDGQVMIMMAAVVVVVVIAVVALTRNAGSAVAVPTA